MDCHEAVRESRPGAMSRIRSIVIGNDGIIVRLRV